MKNLLKALLILPFIMFVSCDEDDAGAGPDISGVDTQVKRIEFLQMNGEGIRTYEYEYNEYGITKLTMTGNTDGYDSVSNIIFFEYDNNLLKGGYMLSPFFPDDSIKIEYLENGNQQKWKMFWPNNDNSFDVAQWTFDYSESFINSFSFDEIEPDNRNYTKVNIDSTEPNTFRIDTDRNMSSKSDYEVEYIEGTFNPLYNLLSWNYEIYDESAAPFLYVNQLPEKVYGKNDNDSDVYELWYELRYEYDSQNRPILIKGFVPEDSTMVDLYKIDYINP